MSSIYLRYSGLRCKKHSISSFAYFDKESGKVNVHYFILFVVSFMLVL